MELVIPTSIYYRSLFPVKKLSLNEDRHFTLGSRGLLRAQVGFRATPVRATLSHRLFRGGSCLQG